MLYHLLISFYPEIPVLNVARYITFRTGVASMTALALGLLLGPWLIRRLQAFQIGQVIRQEGPQSHRAKAGTPTMGGILILVAALVPTLLWADLANAYVWIAVLTTAAFGGIGFLDSRALGARYAGDLFVGDPLDGAAQLPGGKQRTEDDGRGATALEKLLEAHPGQGTVVHHYPGLRLPAVGHPGHADLIGVQIEQVGEHTEHDPAPAGDGGITKARQGVLAEARPEGRSETLCRLLRGGVIDIAMMFEYRMELGSQIRQ